MAKKSKNHQTLHPVSLGIAGGTLWGLGLTIVTYASMSTGYLGGLFELLVGMYPGYAISMNGLLSALVFGFIDGFVGGWLFGWLYNKACEKLA